MIELRIQRTRSTPSSGAERQVDDGDVGLCAVDCRAARPHGRRFAGQQELVLPRQQLFQALRGRTDGRRRSRSGLDRPYLFLDCSRSALAAVESCGAHEHGAIPIFHSARTVIALLARSRTEGAMRNISYEKGYDRTVALRPAGGRSQRCRADPVAAGEGRDRRRLAARRRRSAISARRSPARRRTWCSPITRCPASTVSRR